MQESGHLKIHKPCVCKEIMEVQSIMRNHVARAVGYRFTVLKNLHEFLGSNNKGSNGLIDVYVV